MNKPIEISNNKTLKLSNVLIKEVNVKDGDDYDTIVLQMENYVKSKGALPIGPLIQKTCYSVNEDGQVELRVFLLRQASNYIHNIESPYKMESVIKVQNCMYARFVGTEENLRIAHDKINVTAYENNIKLNNENYTVYVDQQDDNIVADIFVEKK